MHEIRSTNMQEIYTNVQKKNAIYVQNKQYA